MKLTHSLAAKVTAIILLAAFALLTVLSGAGIIYLYYENAYNGAEDYFGSASCNNLVNGYNHQAIWECIDGATDTELESQFGTDFGCMIYRLEKTINPEKWVLIGKFNVPKTQDDVGYYARTEMNYDGKLYAAEGFVYKSMSDTNSSFYKGSLIFSKLNERKYELIPVCIVCLILSIIIFIFLMCSAGYRRGKEEVMRNYQDMVPFDVYIAAAIGLLSVLFLILEETANSYDMRIQPMILICSVLFIAAWLILLAVFMTIATRVKTKTLIHNTVVYIVLKWVFRILKKIWDFFVYILKKIPFIWKTVLITVFVLVLNIGCVASEEEWMVIPLSGAVFIFVCLIAIALQKLKEGGRRLALGDLDTKIDTKFLYLDFKEHAENLNNIGNGMAIAVNEKMKSEHLKTELITNVSHDIKTPLTSIINYVDLLQKDHSEEQEKEYLEILSRQSAKLKKLTEDLVEASKASTGNISVSVERIDACEFVRQAIGEYTERLEERQLGLVVNIPEQEEYIMADGRLLWRVFDNLLNNVCKYAQSGTRLYVDVLPEKDRVKISFKNISREELNIPAEELMERFVRGDRSRNTEGSGLGLNIARSLTELQKGSFGLSVDGDLFKAEIELLKVL